MTLLSDSQVIEKACDLAHKDTVKQFPNNSWLVDKGDCTYYTEDAQDYFNERYDYYWDEIVEGRIKCSE